MFVSVVEGQHTGRVLGYNVLTDDGEILVDRVNSRKTALYILRELWIARARRHELTVSDEDFRYVHDLNSYVLDGMDPDEWIPAVCGCGGTSKRHVED